MEWPSYSVHLRSLLFMVSRPYARAIAGIPQLMYYDRLNTTFTLEYECNRMIEAPTEVYIPPLHFPHGFNVTLSPTEGFSWTHDKVLHVIYIHAGQEVRNMTKDPQVKLFVVPANS